MEGWRKEYVSHPPLDPKDYDPCAPDFGGSFENSQFRKFLTWLEKAASEGLEKEEVAEILSALKAGINKRGEILSASIKGLEDEQKKFEESKKLLTTF